MLPGFGARQHAQKITNRGGHPMSAITATRRMTSFRLTRNSGRIVIRYRNTAEIDCRRERRGVLKAGHDIVGTAFLDIEISNRDYVNTLARGLEVIRSFTRTQSRMTLSEIARATGMTRATVRRILLTLVHEEYAQTDGKYFSLKPKVLQLGFAALSSMTFLDVIKPVLTRLSATLEESCFAAILDGAEVVYIASASPPDRIVSISVSVGSRAPAHCVSTGRVLVAALPEEKQLEYLENATLSKLTPYTETSKVKLRSLIEETRVKGWSIADQELEIGLRSIAVPVSDRSGKVVCALNAACPSSRITPEDMYNKILLELQAASQTITASLQR